MRVRWNTSDTPRAVVGAMVYVPKSFLDVDRVKAELTVKNDVYWQTLAMGAPTEGMSPTYELWEESEETMRVPRHYLEQRSASRFPVLKKPLLNVLDQRRTRGKRLPHRITLRDQVQAEASLALSSTNDDKIVSLACGKGKTVVALHAASEGDRFPLLIVVHTNALMDQWRENRDEHGELIGGIKKFYGLEDHEIGRVQGPVADWKGKKVVVAMLHTLVLKTFSFEFYAYFRLVIFDEVHRLGAWFFAKAAAMFLAERWGLSATVDREDKMDHVFRLHLGKVVYEDLSQPLEPEVFFVDTGLQVDMSKFTMRSGRVNLSKLQTHLSEHEKRNALILSWIRKASAQDRTIIVLGERLAQLHEMAETLQAEGMDASVYVGATKKDERREALKSKIIFATQQIAKEGLDKGALDTEFILVPFGGKGRLQQSVGRILRKHATKKKPIVVVFEDNIGIIGALSRKMRRFIRGFGYEPKDVSSKQAWKGVVV